jgi:predicted helicase
VALKKRASANAADRAGWEADDLLFVSNYGQGGSRQISFAHFARPTSRQDLPTLKVLGWDHQDTPLHLDAVARELTENLAWPQDDNNVDEWRRRWRSAFTLGHREVITTAERLSIRLAELAGAIRDRIRAAIAIESPRGPLTKLMRAFQESLVHDLDAEGFADMYAQTISYGLLSSRVADPTKKTADDFAAQLRTSPFLRELMQTFLKVGGRQGTANEAGIDFDELGVSDVVELLDEAKMEAVLRDFGDRNRQEDPVIHFFEGFLQAYDRRIRKDRGVFYTPQPVVSYIVQSVHELLQTEFGLADGLADTATWGEMLKKQPGLKLPPVTDAPDEVRTISPDEPFVQILDPATGTATFLVEVIDVIHRTLTAKWKLQRLTEAQQIAAWNGYVPQHLLPRLHAFELMMAPYAIAHMKIGLKLAETGYRFGTEERARIYLTNALEPWVKELPLIGFDALAREAAAVNEIKRHKRFTVVIGNPPYSEKSKNEGAWINGLMKRYKTTIRSEEAQIKTVSNDYIHRWRHHQQRLP